MTTANIPLMVHQPQAHVWFKGIDWDNIHRTEAPFKPQLRNPEDTRHFDDDIPAEVSRVPFTTGFERAKRGSDVTDVTLPT